MEEEENLEKMVEENVIKQEELPQMQNEYIACLAKHDLKNHPENCKLIDIQK